MYSPMPSAYFSDSEPRKRPGLNKESTGSSTAGAAAGAADFDLLFLPAAGCAGAGVSSPFK